MNDYLESIMTPFVEEEGRDEDEEPSPPYSPISLPEDVEFEERFQMTIPKVGKC